MNTSEFLVLFTRQKASSRALFKLTFPRNLLSSFQEPKMSKGMFVLLTCLLACSTITAQFDAIDDEEFTAAVAENGASVVSVTGEDASASQPLIADFPASVEPEPSFAGSAELPSAEETTESFVPSVATESEILPEDFEGETVQDSLEDEEALIDEDGASNAKVLTIVGSCIAALGALVVF